MRHRHCLLCLFTFTLALTAVRAATRPNILFAIADDWSFPHASIHDCTWIDTPHFDRVARAGLLFTRAYTPVAKCSASRASIITGRNPWVNESGFTHWNYFPHQFASFAEILGQHGYVTGFTGKGWMPGVAETASGKQRQLLGKAYQKHKLTPPTSQINATDYVANFRDFLDDTNDEPWFFWWGSHQPHRAYEYMSGAKIGGKKVEDLPGVPAYWPDTLEVRHDILDYAFEVEYFDTNLGNFLAELERRGELANTVVIVTSDNGMPFPRAKGQCYEIANHLPLAIHWPDGITKPGRVVDDFVSFVDFAPTFLEVAGLDPLPSGMAEPSGRSLLPLLQSEASGQIDPTRDYVLIGRERHDPGRPHNAGYPVRGIVSGDFMYLHNFAPERWPAGNPEAGYLDVDRSPTKDTLIADRSRKGSDAYWSLNFGRRDAEELYNVVIDPDNVNNLARSPMHAAIKAGLRERMFTLLEAEGDKRLTSGDPNYFDQFRFSNDSFNDLYERWQSGDLELPHWADPDHLSFAPQPHLATEPGSATPATTATEQ